MMRYLLVLLVLVPNLAFGQCDDENEGCDDWSVGTTTIRLNLSVPDCIAEVRVRTRMCGDIQEYYVVDWTVEDGCGGFDPEMTYFHKKREALREYIVTGLAVQAFSTGVPWCSTGAKTNRNVYFATCGIWLSCEYTLPPNPEPVCETGWSGPPPHYGTNPVKVKSWSWFSCGTQCCKRVYEVCKEPQYARPDLYYLKLTLISKVPIGDCSGQATFSPKPCETDCHIP
jgi:hypothetical protein